MGNIVIILLGIVLFIDAIFDKYRVWNEIEYFGARQTKSRLLYLLTQCRFCLLFWTGFIIWIIAVQLKILEPQTIAAPFLVAGLTTLKHKL